MVTATVSPSRPVSGSIGMLTMVSLSWLVTSRKRPSGEKAKLRGAVGTAVTQQLESTVDGIDREHG